MLMVRGEEIAPLRAHARQMACAGAEGAGDLPLTEYFRLLQRVAIKGRDEACRLSSRPLAPGTTDFVVDTLRGATDLEDAMKRVARVYNLVHGGFYNRVERRRDRLVYVIDDRDFPYAAGSGAAVAFTALEGVLIFLHAMLAQSVTGDLGAALRSVRTRRPARAVPDGLLAFWTVPVRCKSLAYALEYDISAAVLPVRPEPTCAADVYAAIDALIAAREHSAPRTDFPARVVEAIAAGATEQPQVARMLGVSIATLRRRLAESSRTFRDLRAQALNEAACALLEEHRHAQDVAEMLGFADTRSFSRAFKSWNGVTPAAFAAAHGARA